MTSHPRQFAVLMSSTHFVQHFLNRMLPPLIPILAFVMGYPLWMLGLLVTISSLGSGLGQAPLGELSDRYDRRYLLPTGLFVAAAGYTLFGLSPAIASLLPRVTVGSSPIDGPFIVMCAAILLAGFGRSAVHPTGYPLISANVSADQKGKALGMWGSAAKLGDAASPALIGFLLLTLVWHDIVVLMGAFGLVFSTFLFVVLGADRFDTAPPESDPVDEAGDSGESTSLLDADKRVFVYPMLAVLGFFLARKLASNGVQTFVPVFITDVYGYSITLFGVTFAPESFANFYFSALLIMAAVVQLGTGALTDRYDHRKLIIAFMSVASVALFVLANVTLQPTLLLLTLLLIGGTIWGINPTRDALVSDISPDTHEGRTFGYLWTGSQVLGSFMPVAIGYIADVAGIRTSFQLLAFGTILAALSIVLLFDDRVYVDAEPSPAGTAGE